ncbi:transcription factor TFIID complex subunit Taf5 [Planoprotostelium fungivorum]|uniref:Transcription factor TFIID complex subunit Taf5 n=1 Tax=Planoprotostelium fungivorum TaxID=1890364 RepID=A0A2P6NSY6_9EUKA|nr:transcription factor TFIID complex subunit Taf5 [Planoprotostelium fungivorum]
MNGLMNNTATPMMSGQMHPANALQGPAPGSDQIDQIINFLSKKGLKKTEQALRQELAPRTQNLDSLAARTDAEMENPSSVSAYIQNYPASAATTDVKNFAKSYSSFRDWVTSSLDIYKRELKGLLYPIFVYCYLDLQRKGESDEAKLFMDSYGKEHAELHEEEVRRLSTLQTPEQLKDNELATQFTSNKFRLDLSRMSFELLLGFLHQEANIIVLGILNRYIHLTVMQGKGVLSLEDGPVLEHNIPHIPNKQTVNAKECYWGLFDEQVPKIPENLSEKAPETPVQPEDEEPQSKKAKVEEGQKKGKASIAQKETQPPPDLKKPPVSTVKLPRLSPDMERSYLEDLSKRASLSTIQLPSVCFYTAFHSYGSLNNISVSDDALYTAGCYSDSSVRLWCNDPKEDTESGNYLHLRGHTAPVTDLSFSPDSKYFLSASQDHSIRLWSTKTKSNVVIYKSHHSPVWSVSFSALGYYFASASYDRTARLWATDNVNPIRVFNGHLSDVNCIRFHPNCNYVVTGSSDNSVRLWDVNTAGSVRIFTGHYGPVHTVAVSPDGKYVASAGEDHLIMLWDLGSGRRVATFSGHKKMIWSLDFSAETSLLASGGADETVRLWDCSGSSRQGQNQMMEDDDVTPATDTKTSSELIKSLPTKRTPVFHVKFTKRNMLMAAGPYRDE